MIKAVQEGVVYVHAIPFNIEAEFASQNGFETQLRLVKRLTESMNVSAPQTMSLRDVPGVYICIHI